MTSVKAQEVPAKDEAFGLLKDVPVYIQEWHIWWGFPYPNHLRGFSHMYSPLTSYLEPWRLNWDRNGYPYPGLYDSNNPEIIRWQIRCMKAAGFESVAVMIHPELGKGTDFIQEYSGAPELILKIAAEEKFPVFFMDEVAFRHGISRDPDVMAKRVVRFLKKYGSHPGFYKIDGKPVYYYQTFGYWPGKEATEKMMTDVEAEIGDVHWMIFGSINSVGPVPKVDSVVGCANHRSNRITRKWDPLAQNPVPMMEKAKQYGKKAGELQYPKFDGTSQPWRQGGVGVYGKSGNHLLRSAMETMKAAHPDFLMFSSWNDWEEGANLEPGWDFDGFVGDPFLYCRLVARLKGRKFVPPPPPDKKYVHPTIWEKLGYGDGAGPILDRVRRCHDKGGSIEVVARDTVNPVVAYEVVWSGDLWWRAPQAEGEEATGTLTSEQLTGKPERVIDTLGYTPGHAVQAPPESVVLKWAADYKVALPEQPTVGAIWAFDPLHPYEGPSMSFPLRDPMPRIEPKGQVDTIGVRFGRCYRSDQVEASVWNGLRSAEAIVAAPIDRAKLSQEGFQLNASGLKLAGFSMLGAPQKDRIVALPESTGLRATFYIRIPDEILEQPGLHFLWVRAKDKAGNWGSPKLLPVSNYEFYPRAKARKRDQVLKAPKNAVLVEGFENMNGWKTTRGKARRVVRKQVLSQELMAIADTLYHRDLSGAINTKMQPYSVRFKMLHENYRRGGGVFLTDKAGQHGYGVMWDSSGSSQHNGEGTVFIVKIDAKEPIDFDTRTKAISGRTSSGHRATEFPYAKFELVLDGAKQELVLKVDGVEKARIKDDSFSSFERVYLRGNRNIYFDELTIVPVNGKK